ncbi:hypothetical protein F2Q69_00045822 [Brassica cretica]|uniref:Uncharacterized protein n=1 Tax=Brassica cretica TaxID=69181 RepID=A0A8S9NE47_BRACR|nr:hypothetical protein F2Q69_00045822 [Brassica cretica]
MKITHELYYTRREGENKIQIDQRRWQSWSCPKSANISSSISALLSTLKEESSLGCHKLWLFRSCHSLVLHKEENHHHPGTVEMKGLILLTDINLTNVNTKVNNQAGSVRKFYIKDPMKSQNSPVLIILIRLVMAAMYLTHSFPCSFFFFIEVAHCLYLAFILGTDAARTQNYNFRYKEHVPSIWL